ncbi:aminopeptidase [Alicyclobacillus fastidiosus]|uniref:Aminopeptidase n=1 Tax=Alicyclobacillus fastidiosus TaxID=392011 RepID=A0ABY6ZI47_9BACL|nr:aminopeptidase [Alicyclobacillus fastidiosus]WAH42585.1 aminopeptidase [Alicyclobacillus fastidiosus]
MDKFEQQFEAYAELAVRLGVNVQPGQLVVIDAELDAVAFVRVLAQKAYDAGARMVHVEWSDAEVNRTKLLRSPADALSEYPRWKAQGYLEMAEAGAAFIGIHTPKPGFLKDVAADRLAASQRAAQQALQPYQRMRMSAMVSWLGMLVPTQAWADQVFQDLPEERRLSALWDVVFRVTRADRPDPIGAWRQHIGHLQARLTTLNDAQFKCLRYRALGTDLTIELPFQHVWVGGGNRTATGVVTVPNIPTEECFTAPLRTGVNGVVRSTKPLYYGGKLVDNFSLTFHEGRLVDFTAEVGHDVLESIITTDEGARYLGEVALVPHSSPISQTGLTFYHTLFDENASCHIALGAAYPINQRGGAEMSKEDLLQRGVNSSMVHVDFMIGSAELDIDAQTRSGEWIPLFRQGEWAD